MNPTPPKRLSSDEILEIERQYAAAFGGLEEFCIAELAAKQSFWHLVRAAVERGRPLTRPEIDRHFPDTAWNY